MVALSSAVSPATSIVHETALRLGGYRARLGGGCVRLACRFGDAANERARRIQPSAALTAGSLAVAALLSSVCLSLSVSLCLSLCALLSSSFFLLLSSLLCPRGAWPRTDVAAIIDGADAATFKAMMMAALRRP